MAWFTVSLHYYSGDYVGACDDAGQLAGLEVEQQYGGALQAISWHSPAEEHQTKAYAYAYDAKYQLKESSWGEVNLQSDGSYRFTASSSFAESVRSYDAHGNIEGLTRTGKQGSLTANYGYYDYKTGNNQLLNIRSSKESLVNLRKYEYNKTGQLISEQQQAGQSKYLQYDAYGQVIAVYADAGKTMPIVKYAYNDQGYQVLKKHYNKQGQAEKDTWYVRDASGSVLSIYEEDIVAKQPLSQIEFPVYAQGRLGMLSTRGNDEVYQYELSDHIGNVRAVISRQRQADGSIDVLHYRDYYSFGSVIEDNERNKGSYRFGYQGQYSEEDEKTSWHSFELRQYDSDIGRWNSIDPYGQYASPYVAMGNAPNMMVDMDGGWSGGPIGSKISFVKNVVDWARVGKFALNYALPAAASVGRSYESLNNVQQQNATLVQRVEGNQNEEDEQFKDISDSKNYPGIKVYETDFIAQGSAVTLPGFGIFIHSSIKGVQRTRVLQHEYGHYLDYLFSHDINYNPTLPSPIVNFYLRIGVPSFLNTIPYINNMPGLNGSHREYWTEIRANRWAEIWFGDNLAPGFKDQFPTK